MKQQLVLAFKFLTLTSVYLFTRSRTPRNKLRDPEKSVAVLFILENLKRVLLYNAHLIRDAKNQVQILDNDVRLFKAFLKDCAKIRNKVEGLEELQRKMQDVVCEAEDKIAVFFNLEAENRARNFFQRAFVGSMELIAVAKEVRAIRAKVKSTYEKSRVVYTNRKIGAAARGDATAKEKRGYLV
ncbi:hypothetical protein Salat_1582200 [Sesamum alatum]|uniref:Disease resistance N-terminal domain-containing protein n=1 Tax=Sesamum alatum TaxID=300844 RepID=A0AAE2CMZ0_9LAMI|nr:hypothetical protein Salat_1582200 [Sesamum alatum]